MLNFPRRQAACVTLLILLGAKARNMRSEDSAAFFAHLAASEP